jgi:predicted nucleic acid-binding protein
VVVVDSSVWIDFLNDKSTPQSDVLENYILTSSDVLVGDLVLAEVLQGVRSASDYRRCLFHMSGFPQLNISDTACAIQAAQNYRALRAEGITVRKTIDTLIATRCLMDDIPLLYTDRDFDPFVTYLGLKTPELP